MIGTIRKTWGLLLASLAIIGLIAIGCAPAAAPPSPTPGPRGVEAPKPTPRPAAAMEKVKIHNPGISGTYQFYLLGTQKGFYKDLGIDLEQIVMKSPLAVPALLAGEVDYTAVGGTVNLGGLQAIPMKVVMTTIAKVDFFLITRPEINTVQDLKGKNIAVGGLTEVGAWGVRETVKAMGLDDKELTFISIPDAERISAMKAGSVAGIAVKSNVAMQAVSQGFKEFAFTGDYSNVLANTLSTIDKKIRENREQVKKMIRGTLKSMTYYRDNKEETMGILMKEFNMDRATMEGTWKAQTKATAFDGNMNEKSLQSLVDMGRAIGMLKGPVPPAEMMVDFGPLREVQKELGLTPQPDIKIK